MPKSLLKFCLILIVIPAFPQETKTNYSLKEAIDYAITNNNLVKSSELDRQLAKARIGEVRAGALPQINGNADLLHYLQVQKNILENGIGFNTNPNLPIGAVNKIQLGLPNQFLPNITGSQSLIDIALFSSVSSSSTLKSIADKNVTRTKIDIALNVTRAYYAVLVNEKQLFSINANLNRLDSSYRQAKAEFEQGLARTIDVDRREVSYNNLKEEKIRIESSYLLSMSVLKYHMNVAPESQISLTDKLDETILTGLESTSLQKGAYNNRIEYSILSAQKKMYSYDTRTAKASRYPRLLAIGAIGYNPGASEFKNLTQSVRWEQYSYVGLRLQVPILNGFVTHYRVQQRRIQEQKTDLDIKQLEKTIDLETEQSVINLNNNLKSLQTQKRNLQLAENTLKLLKAENAEGISSNLDVT
ncbi:MAG: TolC family protein, partial [Opitutaceae bacterium]|nr:TolC family protein [Cytophagales bacterium]